MHCPTAGTQILLKLRAEPDTLDWLNKSEFDRLVHHLASYASVWFVAVPRSTCPYELPIRIGHPKLLMACFSVDRPAARTRTATLSDAPNWPSGLQRQKHPDRATLTAIICLAATSPTTIEPHPSRRNEFLDALIFGLDW